MMKIRLNRLWHGYASVRDYLVKNAESNGEDLVIECNGEKMTIPFAKISEGKVALKDGKPIRFTSQHGGPEYGLIDFLWKPDKGDPKLF